MLLLFLFPPPRSCCCFVLELSDSKSRFANGRGDRQAKVLCVCVFMCERESVYVFGRSLVLALSFEHTDTRTHTKPECYHEHGAFQSLNLSGRYSQHTHTQTHTVRNTAALSGSRLSLSRLGLQFDFCSWTKQLNWQQVARRV